MDYYDVVIPNSSAVYEVQENDGTTWFADAGGVAVETPPSPIVFTARSWCVNRPAWMEPLPQGV